MAEDGKAGGRTVGARLAGPGKPGPYSFTHVGLKSCVTFATSRSTTSP
jgi:hypothetical protein